MTRHRFGGAELEQILASCEMNNWCVIGVFLTNIPMIILQNEVSTTSISIFLLSVYTEVTRTSLKVNRTRNQLQTVTVIAS